METRSVGNINRSKSVPGARRTLEGYNRALDRTRNADDMRGIRRLGSAHEQVASPFSVASPVLRATPFTRSLSLDGFLLSSSGKKLDTFKGGWMYEEDESPKTLQRARSGRFLSAQDFFEKWFSGKTRLESCDVEILEQHEKREMNAAAVGGKEVATVEETRSLHALARLGSSSMTEELVDDD